VFREKRNDRGARRFPDFGWADARRCSSIAWAKQLGRSDCASALAETLAEEKATDEKQTSIAESKDNAEAERATEPA